MVTICKSKKALEFLLTNGFVYTLRKNKKKVGKDWITDKRGGKKIENVYIDFIKEITEENINELEKYVRYSGFSSVKEWLEEAKRLNGDFPYYLNKVSLEDDECCILCRHSDRDGKFCYLHKKEIDPYEWCPDFEFNR